MGLDGTERAVAGQANVGFDVQRQKYNPVFPGDDLSRGKGQQSVAPDNDRGGHA